jgi:LytR cell envelope-related transcriptional attenuator
MSSRTVAVTVAVLALGGYVVYKGLNKPNTLSTDGSSVSTSKPKPGASTVATTVAGATTAPAIVATPAPPAVNAKIDVVVANAAEIQGIAAEISTVLQKKGYQLGKATNATPVEASAVYFTAGNDKLAALVAKDLNIPADKVGALTTTPPGVANLGSAGVLVLLGKTFKKTDVPKESALQPGAPVAPGITAATAAPAAAAVTTVKPAAAVTTPATTAKKP